MSCDRTCRSLSQSDYSCSIDFVPVDGCGCKEGTYMNEQGECVAAAGCPCYDANTVIPSGEVISKDGATWWVSRFYHRITIVLNGVLL